MAKQQRINPFYVLLVIVGAAFVVTASAYFVMALTGSGATLEAATAKEPHLLLGFLKVYGNQLLVIQIVLLAIFSFAAMGLDSHWSRAEELIQSERARSEAPHSQPAHLDAVRSEAARSEAPSTEPVRSEIPATAETTEEARP